jgi:hypothetical protein
VAIVLAAAQVVLGCGGGDESRSEAASATTGTVAAGDASRLRERFDRQVRQLLTERGLDPAVIDCALQRLHETVSDTQIESAADEIQQSGVPPAALIDAATEAGAQCAGE